MKHLLVYEPRTEGHHPGWLRFITEDLLNAGYTISLAADNRPEAQPILRDHLGALLDRMKLISVYGDDQQRRGGVIGSVELCLRESGADAVFLCALDEIASAIERRAAFGTLPPASLRGRMGGIYHRPRFMDAPRFSVNRWMKQRGLRRLVDGNWFRQMLLVDPYIQAQWKKEMPNGPFHFLPDPCPPGFNGDSTSARRALGLPEDKKIFLFYGVGSRRKGLHVAIDAMTQLPPAHPSFLLCAGRFTAQESSSDPLAQLAGQGRATSINRYVSDDEEKLLFAAADFVVLPYLNHFGTSGVLSRAAAAGKPVIVSDEQLLGRLVRDYQLGLLFASGDAAALSRAITQACAADIADWRAALQKYAAQFSREAFRQALLNSI